jgi:hypothetical protein
MFVANNDAFVLVFDNTVGNFQMTIIQVHVKGTNKNQ